MKHPAPSVMVSLVGDRHTVKLDSLDRRSGVKELRSMRKRSFRVGEMGEGDSERRRVKGKKHTNTRRRVRIGASSRPRANTCKHNVHHVFYRYEPNLVE